MTKLAATVPCASEQIANCHLISLSTVPEIDTRKAVGVFVFWKLNTRFVNMADTEETPAQRQARIRREKREAKINANAQDRLDKITRLSGRTPEASKSTAYTEDLQRLINRQHVMKVQHRRQAQQHLLHHLLLR